MSKNIDCHILKMQLQISMKCLMINGMWDPVCKIPPATGEKGLWSRATAVGHVSIIQRDAPVLQGPGPRRPNCV